MLTEQDLDYYMSPPQLPCLLSVYGGHSVVVYSLWGVFMMWYIVCCQFMVVTLLLFTHCGCVFIMWYIVCCQFTVVTLLLFTHCECVFIMWCIVCCQFMMVTLLLFIHCGCVFIM